MLLHAASRRKTCRARGGLRTARNTPRTSLLTLSRVYVTVARPSVRPSVCPIYRQQQRRPAGVLPSAPPAGTRYRSIVASAQQQGRRRSTAHSSSTVISSKCEQCHVYSRRRRLNSERRLVSHCVALDAGNDWSSDGNSTDLKRNLIKRTSTGWLGAT